MDNTVSHFRGRRQIHVAAAQSTSVTLSLGFTFFLSEGTSVKCPSFKSTLLHLFRQVLFRKEGLRASFSWSLALLLQVQLLFTVIVLRRPVRHFR